MKRILRLRWHTLGPSLVAIAFLVMLTGWVGTNRLMEHFHHLERVQVARTQAQAEYSLDRRLENLRIHGQDWSQWDDVVAWIDGDAPDFPASNLNPSSLATLQLDGLFYWDTSFVRLAGLLTPQGGELETRADAIARKIGGRGEGWTGIVREGASLYFCTVQPVLPSDASGSPRGWLAMLQKVDRSIDSSMSLQMQIPTRLLSRADSVGISSWKDGDSGVLAWKVPILEGDPATMEIRLDRPMMAMGRAASRQFMLQLLLGLGVVVILSLAILERFVLARIARLADSVDNIRRDSGEAFDLIDPRDDELGNLSRRIHEMVVASRLSRQKLEVALDLAETSSRARMSFLQSMTHELRTPLNGVIGLTEMALKGDLEPQVQEALELSRAAALGLLETINGVLEFSRLEKGEVDLVLEETDLTQLLLDASRVLGFEAERKGVDFLFLASPTLPSRVMADGARLRRIFVNLAGNAVKYTSAGKVVVTVTFEEASETVGISIRDTGIGIAANRIEAVFQPFVQADEESAIRFGGTGLGLSVAQALAKAMGSEIRARSTLGVGSEFWLALRFPVCASAQSFARPQGAIQWDISRPELGSFLKSAIASEGSDRGILVTDSLEKAFSIPQRSVVLCKATDLRRTKAIMDDGRSEIVVCPFDVREIAQAVIRCERAEATIAILASGRILGGVLVGLLEGGGYRTLTVDSPEEFSKISQYGIVRAVVVDREDSKWQDCLKGCPIPSLGIGDPDEFPAEAILAKPVRREELFAALAKLLAAAS
ncbi:MAG: hypothetical protein IPK50_17485 [Fibrobacterota bacterium]|nr:hypothetical protein [Fibrobacterota bacterium]QQS04068.1 MAG: hypothetical protein IPK50_17485 [Fibrobacterota bacterium]